LPTAIFTLNNILTLGTLKAAGAAGISIPDDVSLLGFDDYEWMEVFRPPLSAIRQPVADMAHAAWERLVVLTGAESADGASLACHVRLPCSLVWRGSVAPPRASASAEHPPDEVLPP
jgi:LacI family transcriptional regulator